MTPLLFRAMFWFGVIELLFAFLNISLWIFSVLMGDGMDDIRDEGSTLLFRGIVLMALSYIIDNLPKKAEE